MSTPNRRWLVKYSSRLIRISQRESLFDSQVVPVRIRQPSLVPCIIP